MVIVGISLVFSVEACAELDVRDSGEVSAAVSTQGADDSVSDETSAPSNVNYGWIRKIAATKENNFKEALSISDIVTNPTVKVRTDGQSCLACHTWASYADRKTFCERVDDFVALPTANGNGTDAPDAKPAYLQTVLKAWKNAGCPE